MGNKNISGVEELRLIVGNLNCCREEFIDKFTAQELVSLGLAHLRGEWDFFIDQWDPRQIQEALKGIPPCWTEKEEPYYGTIFWLKTRGANGWDKIGPFLSAEDAGRGWMKQANRLKKERTGEILLYADYRDGEGAVAALSKDVDSALVGLIRANKEAAQ
jgi:hypothetical protein